MQARPRTVTLRAAAVLALALFLAAAAPSNAQTAASGEKIIVSGASGQLGELVVKELLARGVPAQNLILVSRTPEKLAEYAKLGAVTRFGDFEKPESLPAAYAGGTRMLLISISGGLGSRAQLHKNAIDAAIAAGVRHIAYTSFVALSRGDASGIGKDHHETEEILRNSGVAWTMLRNSIYSEVTIPQAAKFVADGRAVVPADEAKVGYVTRGDCAAAAAAVLATPGHENRIYDITGPELIGVREIAEAASAVTGKKIEVTTAAPGASPPQRFGPSLSVTSNHVEQLTGRPATSLRALYEANKSALLGST